MKNFEKYFLNESLSDDELDNILLNAIIFYYRNRTGKKIEDFNDIEFKQTGYKYTTIDRELTRVLGFMEGILVAIGILKPGEEYDYGEKTWKFLWLFPIKEKETTWENIIFLKSWEYLKEKGKVQDKTKD